MAHFLESQVCNAIKVAKENTALSRQATDLLAYIEEENPLFVNNVKSDGRGHGDAKPLYRLDGEKFAFDAGQVANFKEVIEDENVWLKEKLGESFCNAEYMRKVVMGPTVWQKNHVRSLLEIVPELSLSLQTLVKNYLTKEAVFVSPEVRRLAVVGSEIALSKKKRVRKFSQINTMFPVESRRGSFARRIYRIFKKS